MAASLLLPWLLAGAAIAVALVAVARARSAARDAGEDARDREEPDKIATTAIGAGGPTLTMTSKRGDLGLRRLVTTDTD